MSETEKRTDAHRYTDSRDRFAHLRANARNIGREIEGGGIRHFAELDQDREASKREGLARIREASRKIAEMRRRKKSQQGLTSNSTR